MKQRTLIQLEKYYPILANIQILAIHEVWIRINADIRPYTAIFFGLSLMPWLILFGYSKLHHFCFWHRLLLLNIILHSILCSINCILFLHHYEMLDTFFVTLRLTQIILGVSFILWLADGRFKILNKRPFKDGNGDTMRFVWKNERGFSKAVKVFCNKIFFNLYKNTKR